MSAKTIMRQKKKQQKRASNAPRVTTSSMSMYTPTGKPQGYPTQQKTSLIYSDLLIVQAASLIPEVRYFRLNSLFDPDYTGTGHQPLAFDQWKLFYGYYTVTMVHWEIDVKATDLIATSVVSLYVSPSVTAPVGIGTLIELGADTFVGNVYDDVHTFKGSLDVAKWFQLTPQELLTDDLKRTAVGFNPVDAVYLQVLVAGTSTSSSNATVSVRLTYEALFTVPLVLAPS